MYRDTRSAFDAITGAHMLSSEYRPPAMFVRTSSESIEQGVGALHAYALMTGQGFTDAPTGINPYHKALVLLTAARVESPEERTDILWPVLPYLVDSEEVNQRHQIWLFETVYGEQVPPDQHEAFCTHRECNILRSIMMTLALAGKPAEHLRDLLYRSVQTYWAYEGREHQHDFTSDQISRYRAALSRG